MRRAVRARGRALNARWDTVSSRAKLQRVEFTTENLRTPPREAHGYLDTYGYLHIGGIAFLDT